MKVQLFITCLAENFYPHTLENMVRVLETLGLELHFPAEQTCCGQPFFNSGFQETARPLARHWLETFERDPAPIVSPSGSCVDMVRHHYPELFPPGTPEHAQAMEVAARTFEFSEFLVRQLGVTDVGASFPHKVTYHASCHGLRGLGLRQEARQLLAAVRGLEFIPLPEEETCCGFGGIFSVVYPEVSRAMMETKIRHIIGTGAEFVIAADAGCLMNIGGGLHKAGSPIRALHLIDVLAARE
ncbi:MAG: (Fe-S)-binding protein [Anaerolineales bacterium]|nr:(Fe-S)-binding protein [Anaerolineales bacterium]MCX7755354.1 (Fe-S)-binding protein [Anaerolineales bacterium]MDW8279117.1 (Fe-S)-binding protein [Anaerolineales bacterium]